MSEFDELNFESLPDIVKELMNGTKRNCTPIPDDFFERYTATAHDRQIGVSVAYGVICAAGLIANAFVVFLLLVGGKKGATFRAPSTILIMNLAIADTLFLLTLPFSISHRLHKGWKFGNGMCKFEEGVKFLNYYGSVFFITAMAVDRYFVVSRPGYLNRRMARKYMCIVSFVLWALSLVAVIPLLIFAGVDEHGFCSIMFPRGPTIVENSSAFLEALHQAECVEDYFYLTNDDYYEAGESDVVPGKDSTVGSGSFGDYMYLLDESLGLEYDAGGLALCKHPNIQSLHIWLIWNFVIGFVVPFFLITVCYVRLMTTKLPNTTQQSHDESKNHTNNNIVRCRNGSSLREDASKLIANPEEKDSAKVIHHKAKMLMNVLVPCLIVAFLVCWLPYHLFHLLQIKGVSLSSDGACHVIRDVTFCLAFFNSALNPILNSFFLYNFKQRLQRSSDWVTSRLKNFSLRKRSEKLADQPKNNSRDDAETAGEMTLMTSAFGNEESPENK